MISDDIDKIIKSCARKEERIGFVDFDDAYQEGWVNALRAIEKYGMDYAGVKNIAGRYAKNGMSLLRRKEWRQKGMTKDGEWFKPSAERPFAKRVISHDERIDNDKILTVLVEDIFPMCTDRERSLLEFLMEWDGPALQATKEWRGITGESQRTVDNMMFMFRRTFPSVIDRCMSARRNNTAKPQKILRRWPGSRMIKQDRCRAVLGKHDGS